MMNELLMSQEHNETVGISVPSVSHRPPQGSEAAEAATTGKHKTQCSTARHK